MRGFSRRTGWDRSENAFAAAVRRARAEQRVVADLTVANPTLCGFAYDTEAILHALKDPESLVYDADARGILRAREAVCTYYRDHATKIEPGQVLLTTSTSEAYGYLFRLLCDAGDEVLVPQPGYPLFDFLADLEDVRLRTYPLFHDFGWWIDFAELERRITERTKAILVVHPANPTGHFTKAGERARLQQLCARFRLALIVDEVFLDYAVQPTAAQSFTGEDAECLTFVLSGLSKIAGLPQMKVGWVVTSGPENVRGEALGRLEVIADTFLSVGAPVQHALAAWLSGRRGIQEQIRQRVRNNLNILLESGVDHFPMEAGWQAILRLPGFCGSAEKVLEECGVVVHPGTFYGLTGVGRVVVSLIGHTNEFTRAMTRLPRNHTS